MTKIAVTGGSGKAGRAVVRDLLEHGHQVINIDRVPSAESSSPDSPAPFLAADLTDYGETVEALGNAEKLPGIEAVVHLAAIPSPVHSTPDLTFRTNITSTHTVFSAAARLGLKRVVWASSETTLGLPFDTPPDYAPVDEEHELRPESSYALSKVLGEEMARQFHRWSRHPDRRACASRTSWSATTTSASPASGTTRSCASGTCGATSTRATSRRACAVALEADVAGADSFIIAAGDTVMKRPSRELMAEVFPGVPVRDGVEGTDTLLSIDKARRVLGYSPDFTWRELF